MKKISLFFVAILICLSACQSEEEPPTKEVAVQPAPAPAPAMTVNLMQEPIEVKLVETPIQALDAWRQHAALKPTLLLFARDPFLQPIPEKLLASSLKLIQQGNSADFAAQTAVNSPAPTLLPKMALTAALQAGLFSKVVWVYPTSTPLEQLDPKLFRQQLIDSGATTVDEAHSFTLFEGVFSGKVRGVPFDAVHPSAITRLASVTGQTITHIDLGFFGPLYKDELKTPLYPLLYSFFKDLRGLNLKTSAATLSYSNLSGDRPLAIRFLGPDIATLINSPEMLSEPFPERWKQRSDTLYLPNFLQNDEVLNRYLALETANPEDSSVKYGLYQINRELKDGTKALGYLKEAVALDPVYALEYLQLVSVAKEQGRPLQALKMLLLAEQAMPDNPFIGLRLAALLIEIDHNEQAIKILEKLQKLKWSKVYFPGMEAQLETMLAAAQKKNE